ncbi:MAG: leucine-rich repeat domain-containing protein [Paludibacteraceae bacterium]|nr:leucine-rich repeat domain-containing protein [Paludibacteraceae bacterium]
MSKRLLTLLFVIMTNIGMMHAERVQIGDLYYNLNATSLTAEVTYQQQVLSEETRDNNSGLIIAIIPETVEFNSTTYSVTSIGANAFYGCTGLSSITIPNSVTRIWNSAFSGCSGLTSINIPNSVTSIGSSAFNGCSSLSAIEVPNSISEIEEITTVQSKHSLPKARMKATTRRQ